MTKITFVSVGGARVTVSATGGSSVMQTALDNGIDGITAECGGAMACATCHVYVDDVDSDRVPPAAEHEADMLEFAACEVKPTSRLSCQIKITPDLDGLVVHLPESQV